MSGHSVSLKCPEVAVFFDLATESSRGVLRGFLRYIRLNQPWNVNFVSKTESDVAPSSLKNWEGDGILAHVPDRETFLEILSKRCPVVLLARKNDHHILYEPAKGESVSDPENLIDLSEFDLPYRPVFIRCDNTAVGRMAADFFCEKGYHRFAYIRYPKKMRWCDKRSQAFEEALSEKGFELSRFSLPTNDDGNWFTQRDQMQDWLDKLPKPVAVLAANDFIGRQVLEVCQRAEIPVPYDVSVLGVDNDLLVCEMSYPSLSSIDIDWDRAGFLAAESLHRQMNGREASQEHYGPLRVVGRSSTEFFAASDPLVVRVMELIRINRGDNNLRVSDILRSIPISERRVQERFKSVVGHSIKEEVKRVRMNNICELIRETDISFAEISGSFGFENANHLGQFFKKEFGITMGDYRKKYRYKNEK